MQVKILVTGEKYGFKFGDIAYVSKTKIIGDTTMFGVKAPKQGVGIIWFNQREIEII
jgi:hypothetical protein